MCCRDCKIQCGIADLRELCLSHASISRSRVINTTVMAIPEPTVMAPTSRKERAASEMRTRLQLLLHRRLPAAHRFVGLLKGLILLERASVQIVPDVHQFLTGAGQAGAGDGVLV